ncbi:ketopantoate reductase [Rhizobiales bacterium GAS188]|nr:ketopantoate reductase [Rhizobiales bacterium GAS188]
MRAPVLPVTGAPVICVHGAGSVGCLIGGLLSGVADVVLIGRPRIGAEIAAHGLHLTSWRGEDLRLGPDEVSYRTDATAALRADLVLVTVKSAATEEVGRELAAVLQPATLVISFQNGLRNAGILRRLLPRQRVLAGMVPFNVVHRGEGSFHRASQGELFVEDDAELAPFLGLFAAAGLPLRRRQDMPQVQWAKLLLNLNNPINALCDLPLKDELAQRDYRHCLALLQREALRAFGAAGIRPARLTPLPAHWIPPLLDAPDGVFRLLASRMLAIDPLARSSTWEDLQAGRRTEIDEINGEVVRLAQSQGLTAPANARLIALIHAAESGAARRWSGPELLAELRQAA